MSKKHINSEHGSLGSYVNGFILSLILTFIPYYLVVNQTVKGAALLITILTFAFLQLMVQVIFFLHLGRGPKPNWNLYFFVSTVGIMLVVVGASIFIINNLIYNMLPSDQAKRLIESEGIRQIDGVETGACYGQHEQHKVVLSDSEVTPLYTYANQCDTLIFQNESGQEINIVFGDHPKKEVYAGEDVIRVRTTRNNSVSLSDAGSYHFYNEDNPEQNGYFIVETTEE